VIAVPMRDILLDRSIDAPDVNGRRGVPPAGWRAGCAVGLLLGLGACATTPGGPEEPGAYVPMELQRHWTYEFGTADGRSETYAMTVLGGDVRSLPDEAGVVFRMVYGRPVHGSDWISKSIYALRAAGTCEFHFAAPSWSLEHEPPIPLLPAAVEVGAAVEWSGILSEDGVRSPSEALVRVEAFERHESPGNEPGAAPDELAVVRVVTTYSDRPLQVRRWFAAGVGLLRMEVTGAGPRRTVVLTGFAAPPGGARR